jgi:DNA-binding SARP family transcriptional activator
LEAKVGLGPYEPLTTLVSAPNLETHVTTLRTLGGLEIRRPSSEGSVKVRLAPQPSALLVYVALARPLGHRTRDQITATLWSELTDDRARDALNQAIFRIRDVLGHDVVQRQGEDIRLGDVQCDAVVFDAALDGNRLEDAVDIYGGDFLAGVYLSQGAEFERWVDQERERLRSRAVSANLTLAKREERSGSPLGAVNRLRQALIWSPYEEPVARDLIRLLVQHGDPAAAVHVYESFAARLASDLELSPSGDLEEYASALRRGASERKSDQRITSGVADRALLQVHADAALATSRPENDNSSATAEPTGGITLPARRPGRLLRIALAAAGAAVAVAVALFQVRNAVSPPSVSASIARAIAVSRFSNETRDTANGFLTIQAADWIAEAVSRSGLAEVAPGADNTAPAPGRLGAARAESLARPRSGMPRANARILVAGSLFGTGDTLLFRARISDAVSGALLTGPVEALGPRQHPEQVLEELAQRAMGALAPLLDERFASWARVASRPSSLEAYQLYAAGLDRLLGSRSGSENVDYLLKAAALDSAFTAPLVWALNLSVSSGRAARADSLVRVLEPRRAHLAPWDRAMFDFGVAQLNGNFAEAYAAMRRVVELAPHSEWELELGFWALWINRPREAIERLARIDPEQRVRPYMPRRYWFTLLAARHLLGDYQGVLSDVSRMRSHQVEARLASTSELAALAAMGRVAEVDRITSALLQSEDRSDGAVVLDAVMEFRVHGHSAAAERLLRRLVEWYAKLPPAKPPHFQEMGWGVTLFAAGRLDESRKVFDRVLLERPDAWTARGYVAQIDAREGDRAGAEREIRWQLDRAGEPIGSDAVIHAAAIAAELSDSGRAVHLTRQAMSQGFYYAHPSTHRDPRLERLWQIPAAAALLRPRG